MPTENNKLINNGYLRTPYVMKNNGHGGSGPGNRITAAIDVDDDVPRPMADDTTNTALHSLIPQKDENTNASVVSPLLAGVETNSDLCGSDAIMHHHHSSTQPQCANNVGHIKHPTVVFLGTDSGSRTALQCNVPMSYVATAAATTTQPSQHSPQSDLLLKESSLRCRLLVLAVALTVLGAAIGAMAIYFAGSYRCQQTASHSLDNNQNISNITGECWTHSTAFTYRCTYVYYNVNLMCYLFRIVVIVVVYYCPILFGGK